MVFLLSSCRLTDIDNLFIKRPASWVLAIISGAAIVVGTVFVYTVGKKPVVEMRPILRGLDAFTRAFLGAAWSG